MMSELNKAKDLQPATADAVRVGQLYAIQYTEKVLARGEIKESTNGSYKVHMIDYGETIMVGIERLLLPIPSILTKKAFAFPVRFNDNRERFQHQRLIINFLGSLEDKVQLVETFDMPFTPVVEILLESNIEVFDAHVVGILGKNWFIVQPKMSKELVLKKEDMVVRFSAIAVSVPVILFQDISRFEVTDTVKKGLMIMVNEPEQPKRRGWVLMLKINVRRVSVRYWNYKMHSGSQESPISSILLGCPSSSNSFRRNLKSCKPKRGRFP
jgi:hypothetical protein